MLANNIALHVQISLTPLTPNSLLVLKHKVNLDTLYQIMSTSRLFPRPLSSGPCLLLFLIAHHIPATLPSSCSQQRPWGLCTCAFCCFCLYCSVPQTSAWLVLSHHLHFGSSKRHSPFVLLHFWPSKNILFNCYFFPGNTNSMKARTLSCSRRLKYAEQCLTHTSCSEYEYFLSDYMGE